MQSTDAQVRTLMEGHAKHGKVGLAAMRAGMDRKTARRYLKAGKVPSEMKPPRTWRTREDPFEPAHWAEAAELLRETPELEARTIFELLCEKYPSCYQEGQLRSFQRRVKTWRAQEGPDKEVFFPQTLTPGEAMQTDFTWANELEVTIAGEAFSHMLCHPVLPYSNWEWATVCHSESLVALRRGIQAAVFRLGRVPEFHQTDNSTAATHDLARTGKRGFNDEYAALMKHIGMTPRTIAVGKKNQNGDVEALNGSLKRRLKQHLLVRRSRDFESVSAYEAWLEEMLVKANRLRTKRLADELAVMRPLSVDRLPEYSEERARVTTWSTIRVKRNIYSVPSRLRDEEVKVRLYDEKIEVYHAGKYQLTAERLRGAGRHAIDYRHVVGSLVRKPGAFERYRYREDLFPSLTFRRAYDALVAELEPRRGDIEYVRVLHLAATTMEADVEAALELLLNEKRLPRLDEVKSMVTPEEVAIPDLEVPRVDLAEYDALLEPEEAA
ncbi:MAG: IS21 family transposase [Candidatus Binatia bacterium]